MSDSTKKDGTDKIIRCVDCQQSFTWTAREREFYLLKGFYEPRRCLACRKKKKAGQAAREQ